MESWDAPGVELPTKFNKYKRLKEKEAALAVNKTESSSLTDVSVDLKTPETVVDAKSVQQLRDQHMCQLQQHLTDLKPKPNTVSLNEINSNSEFCNSVATVNGHTDFMSICNDKSVLQHGFAKWPLDLQKQSNISFNCSSQPSSQKYFDSPRSDCSPKLSRLAICTCGTCPQCVRPMSADQITYRHYEERMDVEDAPLNLTLSSSSQFSPSQHRSSRLLPAGCQRYSRQTVVTADSGSGSVVDEHFERSLGHYARYVVPSSNIPITAAKSGGNARPVAPSVTDCVDDHFSKSLGPVVWQRMKENGDVTSATDYCMPKVEPISVDDHFKKALGDETWHRLTSSNDQPVIHSSQMPRYPT